MVAWQCKAVIHWLRDIESWFQATNLQELSIEEKAECRKWWYATKLPGMVQKLEAIIGDKPYFFGDRPSMADIAIAEGFMFDPIYGAGMDKFPVLQRVHANLHAEPTLLKYYEARAAYEATPAFQHVLEWYRPVVHEALVACQLRIPYLPTTLPAYETPEAAAEANQVLRNGPRAFYEASTAIGVGQKS